MRSIFGSALEASSISWVFEKPNCFLCIEGIYCSIQRSDGLVVQGKIGGSKYATQS